MFAHNSVGRSSEIFKSAEISDLSKFNNCELANGFRKNPLDSIRFHGEVAKSLVNDVRE